MGSLEGAVSFFVVKINPQAPFGLRASGLGTAVTGKAVTASMRGPFET